MKRRGSGQNTFQSCCMLIMLLRTRQQVTHPTISCLAENQSFLLTYFWENNNQVRTHQTVWLATHQSRLRDAYQKAGERLQQAAQNRKALHDKRLKDSEPVKLGQLIYLRNRVQGRNKIQDAWSSTPYRVVKLPDKNGAVYAVERADGTGDLRRVHRTAMQICPSEPHICQPARPSSKRTIQNSRRSDEFQREGESDTEDIIKKRKYKN